MLISFFCWVPFEGIWVRQVGDNNGQKIISPSTVIHILVRFSIFNLQGLVISCPYADLPHAVCSLNGFSLQSTCPLHLWDDFFANILQRVSRQLWCFNMWRGMQHLVEHFCIGWWYSSSCFKKHICGKPGTMMRNWWRTMTPAYWQYSFDTTSSAVLRNLLFLLIYK